MMQGLGGAMMVPVGRLVILRTVPKSEMISALAWLTVPALLGPVIGPPLGGFITTYFHWRWIFYDQSADRRARPYLLTWRYITNVMEADTPPLDRTGFAALGAWSFGLRVRACLLGENTGSMVRLSFDGGRPGHMRPLRLARAAHQNPVIELAPAPHPDLSRRA